MDAPEYPEAKKVESAREFSANAGLFLDWLLLVREPRLRLCAYEQGTNELLPIREGVEDLLYEFFKIDRAAYELEKQEMIARLR